MGTIARSSVPAALPEDWLYTTDMLIEGTHFLRATHNAADIGWKTVARGLSDIAAMGGTPRFCLLSLALGDWVDTRWVDGFYRGLLRLAESSGAALIGGDVARQPHVTCDIVVAGTVPRGKALRRGRRAAGRRGLRLGHARRLRTGVRHRTRKGVGKAQRPQPRLALGRFLRERLRATSAMDLSDGLSLDLRRLSLASGLHAEIAAPPIFPGATLEQSLHGGEDYELLFTVAAHTAVPREFQGLPLTRIGTMRKGSPGTILLDGAPLPALGYDHLRSL